MCIYIYIYIYIHIHACIIHRERQGQKERERERERERDSVCCPFSAAVFFCGDGAEWLPPRGERGIVVTVATPTAAATVMSYYSIV